MNVEDWLGKDNTLGISIWEKKYRSENETFEEWLDRVSGKDTDVRRLILEKKFLFGGRILSNRGLSDNSTMSNCYVLSAKDDIRSIYQAASDMAMTYKAGGGCGIDVSSLAPNGAKVNNPAKTSSGAVSFIELFTTTTGLIGQNGRRGALMVSMNCEHPDIEEFINLKTDVNKATTANLSVRVSDDFMKHVLDDKFWNLHFIRPEVNEVISKNIKAKELFQKLCDANYDYGEPGILFWDNIENYNMLNTYENFKFAGINPCFSGDTLILTDRGYVPIKERVGLDTTIWNGYEWSKVVPEITGYNQPMYSVEFNNGQTIECTDYHKFILDDGKRVMCKDLKVGDRIQKYNMPVIEGYKSVDSITAYTNGFYSGDGFYDKNRSRPILYLYDAKIKLFDFIEKERYYQSHERRIVIYPRKDKSMDESGWDKLFVPQADYTIRSRLDWLAGIIDSDGCVNNPRGSIAISSINKQFLLDISLMLNTLGVSCKVSLMRDEAFRDFPANNGTGLKKTYFCQRSYRLILQPSAVKTLTILGLRTHRVSLIANPNGSRSKSLVITSIKRIPNEDIVYCLTEPKNHSVVVNGVMTAQCGELPLPAGGACLLGSMNLSEYVSDGLFKFEDFKKDVATAIRALDTVQDEGISRHPLAIQQQTAKDWKQLGLGIMGLGDMLIKMNIKYGSEESLELCNRIADILAKVAIIESAYLGEVRGSFPKFDSEKTMSSAFMLAHAVSDKPIKAMRNSQLLAIAPTGTISTMLGVSGGIEPLYALEFERTTKSLHGTDMKYKVLPKVVEESRMNGHTKGLVCAKDINYIDRIKMQSVWQKHIDGSISSTINIPHEFPKEKIYDIYVSAWKYNLKGVTIFRDGCKREGILTTKPKTDVVVPEDLIGYKKKIMTGCGSVHLCIYLDKDGNPKETFLARGSSGSCINTLTGLSRMTSLALRNNIPLEKVLDQLDSCGVCPAYAVRRATKKDVSKGSCCPSALANAIREVVSNVKKEDMTKPDEDGSPKCPECGVSLIAQNGCWSCSSCGYSRCG